MARLFLTFLGSSHEEPKFAIQAKRSGDRSCKFSTDGVTLSINSLTIFPEIAARLSPIMACPVATTKLFHLEVRPRKGSPSGEQGRKPTQGVAPAKSSMLKFGKYLGIDFTIPRIRDSEIVWLVPLISMVPANRRLGPIGVTATRASVKIEQIDGCSIGVSSVML